MGRPNDASTSHPLVRVPASTRLINETRVVCAVGWDSEVQLLDGAARVVWEQLETPQTIGDLASRIGVEPSDDYLLQAAELLEDTNLIQVVE